ncbi:hypothetical protein Tco_1430540 [Tanacetum coccineum]
MGHSSYSIAAEKTPRSSPLSSDPPSPLVSELNTLRSSLFPSDLALSPLTRDVPEDSLMSHSDFPLALELSELSSSDSSWAGSEGPSHKPILVFSNPISGASSPSGCESAMLLFSFRTQVDWDVGPTDGANVKVLYEGLEEFLLFDQLQSYPNYMPWRHPDSAIDDPKPPVGSYNQEDMRRLSAHVMKIRDMPEGVLVLSGLSQLWVFMIFFVSLSGLELRFRRSFIMISDLPYRGVLSSVPLAAADVAIPDPTLEDLAASTPSIKVMAKAESSKKRKDFHFGAVLSHVAKCTRSAMAQSSGSTTQPNLFVVDSDEESDDDKDAYLSADAIHRDFFPFSPGPYYATYPEGGIAVSCEFIREGWNAPHQPTLTVLAKEVFKDPAICKTVVDQFPTPGEMVQIKALTNDQLKSLQERCSAFEGLESQVFGFQKRVADLNDKLSTFDASFVKAKTKRKEQKKKIKSLTENLNHLNAKVARLTFNLNCVTVLEAERDVEIQYRVQGELLSLTASAGPEHSLKVAWTKEEFAGDTRVSHLMIRESTVTHVYSSLKLPSNNAPSSSTAPLGQNEEWINAMVDMGQSVFPLDPNDVVVYLSIRERDNDSSLLSSAFEEAVAVSSRVQRALCFFLAEIVLSSMALELACCSSEAFAQEKGSSDPSTGVSQNFLSFNFAFPSYFSHSWGIFVAFVHPEVARHPMLIMLRVCIIVTFGLNQMENFGSFILNRNHSFDLRWFIPPSCYRCSLPKWVSALSLLISFLRFLLPSDPYLQPPPWALF